MIKMNDDDISLDKEPNALEFDDDKYPSDLKTGIHPLACCLSVLFPCCWLCSCYSVKEQTSIVRLTFGRYSGLDKTPGIHCANPCGRELRYVSQKKNIINLPLTKVADAAGSPVNVSGVVTFYTDNPIRAALAVENCREYVRTSGMAVLKKLVSMYPYERRPGDMTYEHDLKTESTVISKMGVDILQQRVAAAGAHVLTFSFNEISYSEEIAAGMLKRQQAEALIEARSLIVMGAVQISSHAVDELKRRGVELSIPAKEKLLNDLMTVICGEQGGN